MNIISPTYTHTLPSIKRKHYAYKHVHTWTFKTTLTSIYTHYVLYIEKLTFMLIHNTYKVTVNTCRSSVCYHAQIHRHIQHNYIDIQKSLIKHQLYERTMIFSRHQLDERTMIFSKHQLYERTMIFSRHQLYERTMIFSRHQLYERTMYDIF